MIVRLKTSCVCSKSTKLCEKSNLRTFLCIQFYCSSLSKQPTPTHCSHPISIFIFFPWRLLPCILDYSGLIHKAWSIIAYTLSDTGSVKSPSVSLQGTRSAIISKSYDLSETVETNQPTYGGIATPNRLSSMIRPKVKRFSCKLMTPSSSISSFSIGR